MVFLVENIGHVDTNRYAGLLWHRTTYPMDKQVTPIGKSRPKTSLTPHNNLTS